MGFWNNLDLLNRLVFWLIIATVAAPFAFGIAALVFQTRAKKLDAERVDRLQQANETLRLRVRYRSRTPDSRDLPGHAGMIVKKYHLGADGQLTAAP
jgi:hypothetical protein